jgi:DNA-binding HxlR family transcriptional regulator
MKRSDFSHLPHGLAAALDEVGTWWTPLIIWAIAGGHTRFDPLQAELDIARNILSTRLSDLVDSGVLHKQPYSERPPRHEYLLTDKGKALLPALQLMDEWGTSWTRRLPPDEGGVGALVPR